MAASAHAGLSGDVRTPSWSAAVSPHRTQQGRPLPGAARPLLWPTGSIRGSRRCPSLEGSSRAQPVLCRAPGSSLLLAQAATHVIWRQPPIWTSPCTWEAGTSLPSPAESAWPHSTPPQGWPGRGYRQSGRRVRVRVSLPPHLNSHDFPSHSPTPQPHRPGEASYLFSGAGAWLHLNRFASKQTVCLSVLWPSHVRLFATVARQVPLSVGFSEQGYGNGLPFPFPGDLPNPGIEPGSPALQADSLSTEPFS